MDVVKYVSTHRPVNGGYRSSNTEDDVVLKTNKQIYSQLLRATANKTAALLERIDVLVHLLDQLARGGGSVQ